MFVFVHCVCYAGQPSKARTRGAAEEEEGPFIVPEHLRRECLGACVAGV